MGGIRANFVYNLIGTIVPLIVALVTVPIYVSYIGSARFGVFSIVWTLLGYFGFLDLGLSRASANALARLAQSSQRERSQVIVTAFCINLGLGIIGGIIFLFLGGYLFDRVLTVPADLKHEIDTVPPWIAGLLPVLLLSGVGTGALEARERFLTANVLQVAGNAISQALAVLSAVLISPSLAVVIPTAVLSRGFSLLIVVGFVIREEWPISLRSFDRTRFKELLRYGGWVSVTNIISPLLTSLDQLVIGSMLGVAAVTYYAVPMNLVVRSQIFTAALARTLFPRLSRSTRDEARELAEKAYVLLAGGYGAFCVAAIVMATPFIKFWMGEDFGLMAGPVAELLLLGVWLNGLGYIPFSFLQGQGRPDIIAKVHSLELLPFVIALWLLTTRFGILGAAAAFVLRCTLDAGFLLAAAGFRVTHLLPILSPIAFLLTAYIFVQISDSSLINAFVLATFLSGGVMIVSALVDPNARNFVQSLRPSKRLTRTF
jgi:O-antigen/teichoic acid export membrane protein